MPSLSCDLAVLGGGPGGFEAALEGARLGLGVVLVERADLGGTCLNRGCIPTKLFLGATDCVRSLQAQERLGLASGQVRVDLGALQGRKARLLAGTRKAMAARLAAAGVAVVQGSGRLDTAASLAVDGPNGPTRVGFSRLVLATGSRPAFPLNMAPDGQAVLDSDGMLELAEPPESLIIIGGGAIGLEMGRIFSRLGAAITVVEAMERLAPSEDPEVGKVLAQAARREGWDLRLGARAASLGTVDGRARLEMADGEVLWADKALVAVGRRANSEGLGLEAAGIALGRGGVIVVDERLAASDTVMAVGDVNGLAMLAHAAAHQGLYAARRAAGAISGPYQAPAVPWCIHGAPESMRVGATMAEAAAFGPVSVSTAHMAANPIAQAAAAPQGLVRVVWAKGRVRGVWAVGPGASHLTLGASIMVAQAWERQDLEQVMFAHPSLDESLRQALEAEPRPVEAS